MIEILTTGGANSVQDLGRPLYLDQGIGRGGVMDRPALQIANLLVGNRVAAAGLEITQFPFRLRFHQPLWFSVTGALAETRLNEKALPPWWATRAKAGDELRIAPPRTGARMVIAFAGGINVPLVLGSAATDLKSGFGGMDGRGLDRGMRLRVGETFGRISKSSSGFGIDPSEIRETFGGGQDSGPIPVRIMAGAEYGGFSEQARRDLASFEWQVSQQANRQGCLLEGPVLEMNDRRELLSHGIMPGTIQVPPSGQPIIQLAEANTCGGYPKIAHVIEPDLWMLGQSPPGAKLSFALVSRQQAIEARRAEAQALARMARDLARIIRIDSNMEAA